MVLTEQQKKWNESVEEAWRNRNNKNFTSTKNPCNNPSISDLYEELKAKILKISEENIFIVDKSNYISFKVKNNHQNFVDVQLQKSVIKCVINLKKSKTKSNSSLRDISKIGHFGSGDYEATIRDVKDINLFFEFIVQSFKENS